jgi:hypothetical protein
LGGLALFGRLAQDLDVFAEHVLHVKPTSCELKASLNPISFALISAMSSR